VFENIDVMIVDGSDAPYRDILFWAGLATMPHLPSVAIPIGHTAQGLPVGMQLIGPTWSAHKILSIGEEISSVLGKRFTPLTFVADWRS
jgi:amidase